MNRDERFSIVLLSLTIQAFGDETTRKTGHDVSNPNPARTSESQHLPRNQSWGMATLPSHIPRIGQDEAETVSHLGGSQEVRGRAGRKIKRRGRPARPSTLLRNFKISKPRQLLSNGTRLEDIIKQWMSKHPNRKSLEKGSRDRKESTHQPK
jgi:hypothetical protein